MTSPRPPVLVTGAGGYLGLHIVQTLLAAGHRVTALARDPAPLEALEGDLHIEVADLEDPDTDGLLAGHDAMVHAALIWGDEAAEAELRDATVAARLFDTAGNTGLGRAIFLSSAAVHRPFTSEMSEADPLSPTGLYGITKAAGERALREACQRHGMTGVALRAGPVVGPAAVPGTRIRTPRPLEAIVRAALDGSPIDVVAEDGRQLVAAAAVARAVARLLDIDRPDEAVLCMDRRITPWEAVARLAVSESGSTSSIRVTPSTGSPPRFRTDRIDALLGGRSDASEALRTHVHLLVEQVCSPCDSL